MGITDATEKATIVTGLIQSTYQYWLRDGDTNWTLNLADGILDDDFYAALKEAARTALPNAIGVGSHYQNIDYEELDQLREAAELTRVSLDLAKYLPYVTESEFVNRK